MFKIGDIIKVIKQPKDLFVQIIGEVAYIEDIKEDFVSIRTIKPNGCRGGGGSIPISCIELEGGDIWKEHKKAIDAADAQFEIECKTRQENWLKFVDKIANKYNLSRETIINIRNDLSEFDG